MSDYYIPKKSLETMFPLGTLGHNLEYFALVKSETKSFYKIITDTENNQKRLDKESKNRRSSGKYSQKVPLKFLTGKSRRYLCGP